MFQNRVGERKSKSVEVNLISNITVGYSQDVALGLGGPYGLLMCGADGFLLFNAIGAVSPIILMDNCCDYSNI